MKNNCPIIVSYYTLNTAYEQVIQKYLLPSLKQFDLRYEIDGISNFGSWKKNTDFKVFFIREKLKKYEEIVWLDCDATIVQYPALFSQIPKEYSLAMGFLDWRIHWQTSNKIEPLSGTLLVRRTAKEIIKKWIKYLPEHSVEQLALGRAVVGENIYKLPVEYFTIVDKNNNIPSYIKNPVIVHHQASRQLKRSFL